MTTNDLIYQLIDKGIKLIPQAGGELDVDGPASALTPELIEALRQHKATILRRMRIIERSDAEPVCRRLDRLICEEWGEAERIAYRELAHSVDGAGP